MKWIFRIFTLAILLALSACSLKPTQPVFPNGFPTALPTLPIIITPPAGATPDSATPTAAISTTTLPTAPAAKPTSTIPASTFQAASALRISFDAGATASDVTGSLPPAGATWYVIGALQGQTMILSLSSANDNTTLEVTDPSGNSLGRPTRPDTAWSGVLPASGDYLVKVFTEGASPSNFDLSVTIPQRIVFETGGISSTVDGSVGANHITNYLARASAGQTMTVTLSAPANSAAITVYGLQDGQPLVRAASGATSWSGKLPATQDYMIDVVSSGSRADYSLKITIK